MILALGSAGVALVLGWSAKKQARFEAALRAISGDWEAEVRPASLLVKPRLVAEVHGHGLVIELVDSEDSQVQTHIIVSVTLPPHLTIGLEGVVSGLRRFFGQGDIRIGVEGIDQRYLLRAARDEHVLTRLGARTRRAIVLTVGAHGVELKEGVLRWKRDGQVSNPDELQARADELIELADALTDRTGTDSQMLLRHAFEHPDPELGFRRACFELLLRQFPDSEAASAALTAALQDPSPVLRFVGARHRGADGLPLLRELVRGGALPEALRVEAVALLGSSHGGGLALAVEDEGAGGLSLEGGAARGGLSKVKT
jgi:hypothetical protein